MKLYLIIFCTSVILLFTGCYTQLYVEKERPEVVESEPVMASVPVADTMTYVYYPLNEFIPIDNVPVESENPLVSASGEIEQQPEATDEWLVNPMTFGQESDWMGEHAIYTIEPGPIIHIDLLPRSQPIQDIGIPTGPANTWHRTTGEARGDHQNSVHNSTQTATATTPVTVHRTSGVERTAVQNPVTTSSQDDTRNSGTTRRGKR